MGWRSDGPMVRWSDGPMCVTNKAGVRSERGDGGGGRVYRTPRSSYSFLVIFLHFEISFFLSFFVYFILPL